MDCIVTINININTRGLNEPCMSFQPAVKQPRRFRNRRLETTTMWPPEELSGRLPGQANELATSSKNRDALFQGSMPPELQNPFALVRAGPKLQTPQELWGPETSGVAGAMAWAVESLQRDSNKTPKRENRQGIHGSVGVGPLQAVRCPELPVFQRPAPAPASQEAAARAESAERGRKRGAKDFHAHHVPRYPIRDDALEALAKRRGSQIPHWWKQARPFHPHPTSKVPRTPLVP